MVISDTISAVALELPDDHPAVALASSKAKLSALVGPLSPRAELADVGPECSGCSRRRLRRREPLNADHNTIIALKIKVQEASTGIEVRLV